MVKAWVFGSLVAGVTLFSTAFYIQTRPLAFTQSGLDASMETAVRAPDVAPLIEALGDVREDPEQARVFELAPIYVTPRPPGPAANQVASPLEPCSDWRDIGPSRVEQGEGLDSRRVRELC